MTLFEFLPRVVELLPQLLFDALRFPLREDAFNPAASSGDPTGKAKEPAEESLGPVAHNARRRAKLGFIAVIWAHVWGTNQ